MKKVVNNSVIELKKGDITEQHSDAIVNAANEQLILGAGVAGAIRMKGGPDIQKQCDKIGSIRTGQAVITSAGRLKAKYVIHAVGPRQGQGMEDEKLSNAVVNSLKLANENKIKSISFPAISTGIFGFPVEKCAKVMIEAVHQYLKGKTEIEKVVFCLFDSFTYNVFLDELVGRD